MGSEVLLQPACELSYQVARDGAEAEPPIEPPAAMRSFLYVADLPGRALTVAQQAIEDDPSFRRRVAAHAEEDDVGRAGYLWLHRPIGWAAEFEELSALAPDGDDPVAGGGLEVHHDGDFIDDGVTVTDPNIDPALVAESLEDAAVSGGDVPAGAASALGFGSIDAFSNGDGALDRALTGDATGRSEANAIEDELDSLRGLVDRLSSERKAVSTSVRRVEQEVETSKHQPSVFDSDIYSLQSELDGARHELDQARAERDNAVRQHSDSLTRQLELERELDRSREMRAEVEREHADVDAGLVELRESLARSEASLATITDERDDLSGQVADLGQANESLNTQIAEVTEESASVSKSLQADFVAVQGEAEGLRTEKDELATKFASIEAELGEAQSQLNQTGSQAAEAKSLVDALTEEKIDLASRLADTEAMLETTRVQLGAVKSDAEAVAADLSNIKAHRDGLSTQVEELHTSLSDALNDLARVRSTSDADRAALKDVRAERDVLRVRVGSLEQIETGLEAKLSNLTSERDTVHSRIDELQSQVGDLDRDLRVTTEERDQLASELNTTSETARTVETERDDLLGQADQLTGQLSEIEVVRDGLSQQVEQLTGENASIQSQLVESDRLRSEAAENQGHALSELAQRLSIVENERARLERDLGEAEGRLSEALVTLEAARDEAARNQAALSQAAEAPVDTGGDPFGTTASFAATTSPVPPSALADVEIDPPEVGPLEVDDEAVALEVDGVDALVDEVDEVVEVDDVIEGAEAPLILEPTDDLPPPPLQSPQDEAVAEDSSPEAEPTKKRWGIGALRRNDPIESDEEPPPPPVSSDAVDSVPAAEVTVEPEPELAPIDDAEIPAVDDDETDAEIPAVDEDEVAESVEDEVAESVESEVAESVESEVDGDEPEVDEIDSVAAAFAETLQERGSDDDDSVSDDEIDSISTELSQAVDSAGLSPDDAGDDEDLDEISNLISKTVTDFDPKSIDDPTVDPAAAVGDATDDDQAETDADLDEPKRRRGRRLFPGRTPEDDGRRKSGPLPPSIFGDGDDLGPEEADDDLSVLADETSLHPAGGDDADGDGMAAATPRRQIEIPATIADDEVAVARHVVSSSDVVLLVDGDSVAKMGWPSLPVAQQRDALVSYLADLSATTGAAPDVVFDGRIGEEESLPASRAVRIRLSTPPTEPAAALDELVDAYPEQWPIAVVTDSDDLSRSASARGAVVLNNGQLLDLFIAQ